MSNIPKDPIILFSFINQQLRDFYPSLEEFCAASGMNREEIVQKLAGVNYTYDKDRNQFV